MAFRAAEISATISLCLVIIDGRTRYPEVEIVRNTSAQSTIQCFESIFPRHGIPRTIVSDNGSPFPGDEIRQYTGGCQKKGAPFKNGSWFIMTINKENVNKSCVFVPHRYLCVRTSTNCNSYLNTY